jgi:hypothetical protein
MYTHLGENALLVFVDLEILERSSRKSMPTLTGKRTGTTA